MIDVTRFLIEFVGYSIKRWVKLRGKSKFEVEHDTGGADSDSLELNTRAEGVKRRDIVISKCRGRKNAEDVVYIACVVVR